MGTQCKFHRNTLRSQKIQHPHPCPIRKKIRVPWVHAASPHWLQEKNVCTYVLCHFWPRLMEGAIGNVSENTLITWLEQIGNNQRTKIPHTPRPKPKKLEKNYALFSFLIGYMKFQPRLINWEYYWIVSSLEISKKTNLDHQIQQCHWLFF